MKSSESNFLFSNYKNCFSTFYLQLPMSIMKVNRLQSENFHLLLIKKVIIFPHTGRLDGVRRGGAPVHRRPDGPVCGHLLCRLPSLRHTDRAQSVCRRHSRQPGDGRGAEEGEAAQGQRGDHEHAHHPPVAAAHLRALSHPSADGPTETARQRGAFLSRKIYV